MPKVFIDIHCTYILCSHLQPTLEVTGPFGIPGFTSQHWILGCSAAPSGFPPKVKLPVTRSAGALGVWSAGGRTTSSNSKGYPKKTGNQYLYINIDRY